MKKDRKTEMSRGACNLKRLVDKAKTALDNNDLGGVRSVLKEVRDLWESSTPEELVQLRQEERYDIVTVELWTGFSEEYLAGKTTGYDREGIMFYYREWFEQEGEQNEQTGDK